MGREGESPPPGSMAAVVAWSLSARQNVSRARGPRHHAGTLAGLRLLTGLCHPGTGLTLKSTLTALVHPLWCPLLLSLTRSAKGSTPNRFSAVLPSRCRWVSLCPGSVVSDHAHRVRVSDTAPELAGAARFRAQSYDRCPYCLTLCRPCQVESSRRRMATTEQISSVLTNLTVCWSGVSQR